MFHRRDRPELTLFALGVLLFGVVVGPLVHLSVVHGAGSSHLVGDELHSHSHAVHAGEHSHGHSDEHEHEHEHDAAPHTDHEHAPGTTEHLVFTALPAKAALALAGIILPLSPQPQFTPSAPALARARLRAMPQGP